MTKSKFLVVTGVLASLVLPVYGCLEFGLISEESTPTWSLLDVGFRLIAGTAGVAAALFFFTCFFDAVSRPKLQYRVAWLVFMAVFTLPIAFLYYFSVLRPVLTSLGMAQPTLQADGPASGGPTA